MQFVNNSNDDAVQRVRPPHQDPLDRVTLPLMILFTLSSLVASVFNEQALGIALVTIAAAYVFVRDFAKVLFADHASLSAFNTSSDSYRRELRESLEQLSVTSNDSPAALGLALAGRFAASHDPKQPTLMPSAVVGFVDMISSTSISNALDLASGFELKQRFLQAASTRASESGMVVLNHTGDGFLFLANYHSEYGWAERLVHFHRALTSDFDLMIHELRERNGIRSESGLRFGVSCGPVLLGCLGASSTCFTAVGPDVNLAARLCDLAARNEFVATKRVWDHLKSALPGSPASFHNYSRLRGFDIVINAVHVRTRPAPTATEPIPKRTGAHLSAISNPTLSASSDGEPKAAGNSEPSGRTEARPKLQIVRPAPSSAQQPVEIPEPNQGSFADIENCIVLRPSVSENTLFDRFGSKSDSNSLSWADRTSEPRRDQAFASLLTKNMAPNRESELHSLDTGAKIGYTG